MSGFANLTVLSHPLLQHRLTLLRRKETGPAEFRRLTRELGMLMGYELTRDLPLRPASIETPLEPAEAPLAAGENLCLVSILRAGNGMLDGMLDLAPSARVGHIGLYRDAATLDAIQYYQKLPDDIGGCLCILVDPMLATGHSAALAIERLRQAGVTRLRFACLIAAPEGVRHLAAQHPTVPVYAAGLDRELDSHGYIRPGLGDAGDRLYGTGTC